MYSIMLDKVSKSYQTNNYVVKAVNQADFAADKGTSVAIIGPSGSGKSTLLNMMGLIIYIAQMCQILDVSTKTGYRLIREGKICCIKVGRAYRIPKAHLFTYLCIGC